MVVAIVMVAAIIMAAIKTTMNSGAMVRNLITAVLVQATEIKMIRPSSSRELTRPPTLHTRVPRPLENSFLKLVKVCSRRGKITSRKTILSELAMD